MIQIIQNTECYDEDYLEQITLYEGFRIQGDYDDYFDVQVQ